MGDINMVQYKKPEKTTHPHHYTLYVDVAVDHCIKDEVAYRHRIIVKAECENTDSEADIISRASTKALLELGFYDNHEYVVNTDLTKILGKTPDSDSWQDF